MIEKKAVLEAAIAAVSSRGLNYGKPEDNFSRIARRWTAHLENTYGHVMHPLPVLTVTDVAIMCADLKLARIEWTPSHLDSWVDLAGYAACGANLNCINVVEGEE